MTLLVVMYHRASSGRHGNSAEMLDAHFAYVAKYCHCVLPGEPLDELRLNVCLSFDDAYFDFYAVVHPLLCKHGLRAVLAVPVSSIADTTSGSPTTRLAAAAQRGPSAGPSAVHCTWAELADMANSGVVSIASHGTTHVRLDDPDVDLHDEIVMSKAALRAHTGQSVDCFVLPYGRFSPESLAVARLHYRYVFRIGSADNPGWGGKVVYRIDGDEMGSPEALFSRHRRAAFRLRRYWNRVRSR